MLDKKISVLQAKIHIKCSLISDLGARVINHNKERLIKILI
jgi:hypothetical protein